MGPHHAAPHGGHRPAQRWPVPRQNSLVGLTWDSTISDRAHPTCLPAHGLVVRLADPPRPGATLRRTRSAAVTPHRRRALGSITGPAFGAHAPSARIIAVRVWRRRPCRPTGTGAISAARRAFSPSFFITQRDAICRLPPPTQYGVTGLGRRRARVLVAPEGKRPASMAGSHPAWGTRSMRQNRVPDPVPRWPSRDDRQTSLGRLGDLHC